MKIKSNKTFECYETAFESWNNGKSITLDGQLLIPIDRIKQAREEIENINPVYSTIGDRIPVLKNCDDIKAEVLEILDGLISEVEEC